MSGNDGSNVGNSKLLVPIFSELPVTVTEYPVNRVSPGAKTPNQVPRFERPFSLSPASAMPGIVEGMGCRPKRPRLRRASISYRRAKMLTIRDKDY